MRMYSASANVASQGPIDILEINAPSDAALLIHKIIVTQISDAGDAESEQMDILIHRGSTSGSGGASVTAAPLSVGDPAFGGTVESGNTSQGTEGTVLHREGSNVMAGFAWPATPEERIEVSPSGRIIVELATALADSITMRVTAYFQEIGG
ncbi:MAG: hypothetical protein ACWGQW_02635 [bacterium]